MAKRELTGLLTRSTNIKETRLGILPRPLWETLILPSCVPKWLQAPGGFSKLGVLSCKGMRIPGGDSWTGAGEGIRI